MRVKKKRLSTALMLAGLLLLASALALVLYNLWDDARAGEAAADVLDVLNDVLQDLDDDDDTEVPLYILEPDMEMPTVEIDGHLYIGRVDIPDLALSLPVMSEWSYPNLKIAPCRYSGSAYKDNLVIAGHNYRSQFRQLRTLSVGAQVVFTDVDGNVFNYTAQEIEQLAPTAVEQMTSGDWALTLFTCTVGGEYRLAVRCGKAAS